jgi:zinc/manganese transport system substrate-binding protein
MNMKSFTRSLLAVFLLLLVSTGSSSSSDDKVRVVATLTTLGSIAQAIGGERIDLMVIANGVQDPHYVDPKPSFMTRLRKADLLLLNGLDLEVGWVPPLTEGARNPKILRGGSGFVDCSANMPVVEIPTSLSRAEGDIHPFGNPHYLTDPLNAQVVAATVTAALQEADPGHADVYEEGRQAFVNRLHRKLFGDELVDLAGGAKLAREAFADRLDAFLDGTSFGGAPLRTRLGGWMGRMEQVHGSRLITYYRDYSYLAARFGLQVVDTVEPKAGIPPSAKHLEDLVKTVGANSVRVIVSRPYAEHRSTNLLAKRTGIRIVDLPMDVGGAPGTDDFFQLQDHVMDALVDALSGGAAGKE